MEKRVFLIVLDSFGIGAEPDAAAFGDEGTNTLGAIANHPNFNCPNLKKLGLFNIDGVTAGEKDAATDMLYTVDIDDPDQEPYKVTQEQLKEMDLLLSNPIKRYEIADYDFESAVRNEVRCRIFITDNVSTNLYFKPVRFLGTWYLCLKDSSEGDRPLGDKSKDIAL